MTDKIDMEPNLDWMDDPIESSLWTNLTFLRDGRCLRSAYNLQTEEAAKKHAIQSEAFLNSPENGPIFENRTCGTKFDRVMYSHTIQIPVKP